MIGYKEYGMKRRNFLSLLAAAAAPAGAQTNDQLNFLTGLPDGGKLNEMLPNYVNGKAFALLDQRRGTVEPWYDFVTL